MAKQNILNDDTSWGVESTKIESNFAELYNNKVDKTSVVQTTGASLSDVMSQKAVTDELALKANQTELDQLAGDVSILDGSVAQSESILNISKSWNLYTKDIALNGKLVSNNAANGISAYADAIFSGVTAVELGKKYVISQTLKPIGEIFCYDETVSAPLFKTGAICSIPAYGGWGSFAGKITRTDIPLSNGYYATIIEILDASIKYIAWHMHGFSYWAHTEEQFQQLIDTAQVEEGELRSEYTSYGWENVTVKESALKFEKTDYKIILLKDGSKISVRVRFDDINDLSHTWEYPFISGNGGLNLIEMLLVDRNTAHDRISGAIYKSVGDDIAPIYANNSYVGANHGYYDVLIVTCAAHGKTTADIGSVWNLAGGTRNFILMDIVDSDKLKLFSDYSGNPVLPTHYTGAASFAGTFTHVSNGTNTGDIAFTATVKEQLYPNTNNKSIKSVLDNTEIIADGVYYGTKFDLIESYNITDIPSIQEALKLSVGVKLDLSDNNIAGWIRVNNIFSHGINGSITVKTSYEFLKQTSVAFYGAVQSMSIGSNAYVPGVGIVDGKDMGTVITQGAALLDFAKSTWLNADAPPYRYHQFNADLTMGMALGYNPLFGIAKPATRSANSNAGNITSGIKKMYPYVRVGGVSVPGDYNEVVSFRVPLRIIDADATCLYWYWVGDDIYLAFDYHKNIDKIIKLPSYMAGMKIEQLDIHANTTIQSEFVSADGIKAKVVNNYGYGVIRLFN